MRIAGIKTDDLVHANVRGQHFFARVAGHHERGIEIAPLNGKALGYSLLTPHQIVGHWRKVAGSK